MTTTQGHLCTGSLAIDLRLNLQYSIPFCSMVAHLDSVTSLAVDQHGLYLISGSHDCSIRCLRWRWSTWFLSRSHFNSILSSLSPFQVVESWEQDLCPRDHSPQEKVRREHLWRCFPSLETIHRQVRLKHCGWLNFFTHFLSVLARMLLLRCSSEASGQQDRVKTSILTLYT